jgi:hypothetical protein
MAADRIRLVWIPAEAGAPSIEFNDDPFGSHFLLDMQGFLSNRIAPITVQAAGQRGVSLTDVTVGGRALAITGWISAATPEELWALRETIAQAFVVEPSATETPTPGVIQVYRSGLPTREIEAIPVDSPQDTWLVETTISTDIEWLAPYPYWRGLADETAELVPAGGTEFPIELPFEFVSDAISAVADNIGTVSVAVVIRINGEVDTPRVENVTTGEIIEINTLVPDGDYIEINTGYGIKTVIQYPDETNIINLINLDIADFWRLLPGENTIRFTANDVGENASVTVTWRAQWAGI